MFIYKLNVSYSVIYDCYCLIIIDVYISNAAKHKFLISIKGY